MLDSKDFEIFEITICWGFVITLAMIFVAASLMALLTWLTNSMKPGFIKDIIKNLTEFITWNYALTFIGYCY
jgi:hypothetical protein